MGILDDLKNQTKAQKEALLNEQQRQTELLKHYQKNIHPKMMKLYTFLNEFVQHLNYIDTTTTSFYPITPDGKAQSFNQSGYKITIDSTSAVKDMNLRFNCSLQTPLIFELEHSERILSYTDALNSYKIAFDRTDTKNSNYDLISAKFKVLGPIPVNIIFQADIEACKINMLLHNVDKPGTAKHILSAEHITDEFLDGLGKYILRNNPDFFKLDIAEEDKEKIRQKIKDDLKMRQQELEESERLQAEDDAIRKEKKSWKNIFKKN